MTTPTTSRIYLDYNASTPIAPSVAAKMREVMEDAFGNPSSLHWAGAPARMHVEHARARVAELLGCEPSEIVFTSGGSESNNFALKGVFFARASEMVSPHVVTTAVEHPAIMAPCDFLARRDARITVLPVDRTGQVDPDDLRRAITPDTVLVSVMHANNEVGTVMPIEACAAIAREHGVPFHTDAAQSVGKIPTRVDELGVDLLSIAGHKIHAPKAVGALYIRAGTKLEPLVHGAGHEHGRRAGTESAMLAAALGEACRLAGDRSDIPRVRGLRDRFWSALRQRFGDRVALNGHPELRLPNTLNVSFVGRDGAELLARLEGVAASTGSACHAGRVELSPVLAAMRVPEHVGMGAVRFSLGRGTTGEEIDSVVSRVAAVLGSPQGSRAHTNRAIRTPGTRTTLT